MVTLHGRPPLEASTGARFARAYRESGTATALHYDYTLTEEFKPGEDRPRIAMVSWTMKRRLVTAGQIPYWSESRRAVVPGEAAPGSPKWKEFQVSFDGARTVVEPIRAWVQVPEDILDDPVCLGDFIDYRLIPRLGTVENEAVTIGPRGILSHSAISRYTYTGDYTEGLLCACNEVEQNAATAHVLIVNPHDYYSSIVRSGTLLPNLIANGNVILRTRMVAPGHAVVGDFNVATRFYHTGKSMIRFGTPPADLFPTDGLALCAETCVGVSLNLPTHVYHVGPETAGMSRRGDDAHR